MSREESWDLVCEFVKDEGLRRHIRAVGAAMAWYANYFSQDVVHWEMVGLLHDFDWEIHPTLADHPLKGAPILRERGVDGSVIRTILSHNSEATGVEREKDIDFALLACDEITGLIIAAVLVRPGKNIADLELSSLRKKWKDKAFAAGVDRAHVLAVTDDFSRACFGGQLELWTHIGNVLAAMKEAAAELGLDGRLA